MEITKKIKRSLAALFGISIPTLILGATVGVLAIEAKNEESERANPTMWVYTIPTGKAVYPKGTPRAIGFDGMKADGRLYHLSTSFDNKSRLRNEPRYCCSRNLKKIRIEGREYGVDKVTPGGITLGTLGSSR